MRILWELWRQVNGKFTGFEYEVSNLGKVRNKKTKRLVKQRYDRKGYLRVCLSCGRLKISTAVHRLVLSAFDRPPVGDGRKIDQANHKDGIKTNNRIDNLEWVTCKENQEHAVRLGLREHIGVGRRRRKISEPCVREIKKLIGTMPDNQIGKRFGVPQPSIRCIRLGMTYVDVV